MGRAYLHYRGQPSYSNRYTCSRDNIKLFFLSACVSVNDAFVMDAWGKSVGADGKVLMLADGSALFTKVCEYAQPSDIETPLLLW